MRQMVVTCRKSDIRHIRISCRCGNVFIIEIPQQVARAFNLHSCLGCQAAYSITQNEEGKWLIDRIQESVDQMVLAPDLEKKKEFKQ